MIFYLHDGTRQTSDPRQKASREDNPLLISHVYERRESVLTGQDIDRALKVLGYTFFT